jgi:hypothetical protein
VKKVLLLVAMSLALTVARAEVGLNFWQESRDEKTAEPLREKQPVHASAKITAPPPAR